MPSKSHPIIIRLFILLGAISHLSAAVTVYFYGVNAANDTNPNPSPLEVGPGSGGMYLATGGGVNLSVAGGFGDPFFYRANATLVPSGRTGNVLYYDFSGLRAGAIPGDQNFSYLKFGEGYFEPFESIGQFYFDDKGNGWLIAIATTNSGTTASMLKGNSDGRMITVAEGAAAIAAASVPESSSFSPWFFGGLYLLTLRRRSLPG